MQFTSGDSFGTKLSLLCKFPPPTGSSCARGPMAGASASHGSDSPSHQGPSAQPRPRACCQGGGDVDRGQAAAPGPAWPLLELEGDAACLEQPRSQTWTGDRVQGMSTFFLSWPRQKAEKAREHPHEALTFLLRKVGLSKASASVRPGLHCRLLSSLPVPAALQSPPLPTLAVHCHPPLEGHCQHPKYLAQWSHLCPLPYSICFIEPSYGPPFLN